MTIKTKEHYYKINFFLENGKLLLDIIPQMGHSGTSTCTSIPETD